MTKRIEFAALIVCAFFLYSMPAHAGGRIALVIGNAEYKGLGKGNDLVNTTNDAKSMAERLKSLGFKVYLSLNADKNEMERALQAFSFGTLGADLSFFYFAGHGMQISGTNYLLPTDVKIDQPGRLSEHLVSFDLVKARSTFGVKNSIIVLDACRDNPLAVRFNAAQVKKSKQLGIGFAPISDRHIQLGMSTQPGSVAEDGEGQVNSPYTTALLRRLTDGSLSVSEAFKRVELDVAKATEGRQMPWKSDAPFAKSLKLIPTESIAKAGKIQTKFGIKDKTVETLRDFSWRIMPPSVQRADGTTFAVKANDSNFQKKYNLSHQFLRDIISTGLLIANMRKCGLDVKQGEMAAALFRNAKKSGVRDPRNVAVAKAVNYAVWTIMNAKFETVSTQNGKNKTKTVIENKNNCPQPARSHLRSQIEKYISISK